MGAHTKQLYITPEEYLLAEIEAETKSEYVDGVIVAMSGASAEHAAITFNLGAAISPQLRAGGCRGFSADLRLRIEIANRYYYPDLMIVCGKPEYETQNGSQHLLNPAVLFEVLSHSTEQRDRGEKWLAYRQIPSLTAYILVHQDRAMLERHERIPGSNRWELTIIEGMEAFCPLTCIDGAIALADIYAGIAFAAEAEQPDIPGKGISDGSAH